MKFKIEDREYDFDGEYTVGESKLIWDHAGVGMGELMDHLRRGNPYVAQVLMYVLKRRAGEAVRLQDLDSFNYTAIQAVPDDSSGGDTPGEPEEVPDPTKVSGTSPEPDIAATS